MRKKINFKEIVFRCSHTRTRKRTCKLFHQGTRSSRCIKGENRVQVGRSIYIYKRVFACKQQCKSEEGQSVSRSVSQSVSHPFVKFKMNHPSVVNLLQDTVPVYMHAQEGKWKWWLRGRFRVVYLVQYL